MKGLIIDSPPLDVYEHMAIDELLVSGDDTGKFILRFYEWNGSGITFGYGQNYNYIGKNLPAELKSIQTTRRPTGGGVVFHTGDLTFSCIFPGENNLKPAEIYLKLHRALHKAFVSRKINCRLSGETNTQGHNLHADEKALECFVNPVKHDIVGDKGKKILGGALRRFKNTVLYQGSLQIDGARKRFAELKLATIKSIAADMSVKWQVRKTDDSFLKKVKALAKNKYNSRQWICRF
jgi:lipoate-protein ligase A